jgi:AmiR/NasT family two-component response regulator
MKSPKGIRVLTAEDDYLVGETIKGMLEDEGYTVVGEAADGREAVEMAQATHPDVVLMDLGMPDVDGIQATQYLQDHCPTPVVALTAYETPEMVERASAAGVGAYLVKPPSPREMERAITVAIARFGDLMELRRLNAELQQALDEIKTLRGIIPICASCKKIRDDEGFWQDVAFYIEAHTDAEFTHGICPDCARKLYPEFYEDKKK